MTPTRARSCPSARARGTYRRRAVILCIAAVAGCTLDKPAAEDEEAALPDIPAIGVVLPFSEAPALLSSCDGREARADSFWVPSDAELRTVEASLDEYLKTQLPGDSSGDLVGRYSRQYLGIFRDGEKRIFIRGVSQLYLRRGITFDTASVPASVKVASALRRFGEQAVTVCDGWRGFFRAEYSLPAGRITWFSFQERA